jgi:hypothetical protein
MTGRNNKPDNDGPASSPGRLDQFGDKLASENEDEFRSAAEHLSESNQVSGSGQACESDELGNQ